MSFDSSRSVLDLSFSSSLPSKKEKKSNFSYFFPILYYFSEKMRGERKRKARKEFLITLFKEIQEVSSFQVKVDPLKGGLAYYWYEEEIIPFGEFINQEGGVNELYKICEKALRGPQNYKKFLDFPIDAPFSEDINEDSHFLKIDLEKFFQEFPDLKEYETEEGAKKREKFLLEMKEVIDETSHKETLGEEDFSLRERYQSYLSYLFGEYIQRSADYKIFRFGYFNRLKECDFLKTNLIAPQGILIGKPLIKKAFRKKIIDIAFLEKLISLLNENSIGIFSSDSSYKNLYLKSRKYFTQETLNSIIENLTSKEEDLNP